MRRPRQTTPAEPRPFLRDAAAGALLLCDTLIAYLPAVRGGLLWDDNLHVPRPDLHTLAGLWCPSVSPCQAEFVSKPSQAEICKK